MITHALALSLFVGSLPLSGALCAGRTLAQADEDSDRLPSQLGAAGGEIHTDKELTWWNDPLRALVYPPKKLVFCYIEKNACTQFNVLFNKLNSRHGVDDWGLSSLKTFNLKMDDVSRSKGWRWAVFLRDPLKRYLSAWSSKCVQGEDYGEKCLPRGKRSWLGSVRDFEANVQANEQNPDPLAHDPHWALQQDFCGGLHNATDYDFVGQLSGDVNAQVHKMLRMVGAPEDHVDRVFPKHHIAGHRSFFMDPEKYYHDPAIRSAVMRMYAADYNLPGL